MPILRDIPGTNQTLEFEDGTPESIINSAMNEFSSSPADKKTIARPILGTDVVLEFDYGTDESVMQRVEREVIREQNLSTEVDTLKFWSDKMKQSALLGEPMSALGGPFSRFTSQVSQGWQDINTDTAFLLNGFGELDTSDPEALSKIAEQPKDSLELAGRLIGQYFGPVGGTAIPGFAAGLMGQTMKMAGFKGAAMSNSSQTLKMTRRMITGFGKRLSKAGKEKMAGFLSTFSDVAEDNLIRLMNRGNKIWKKESLNPKIVTKGNREKALDGIGEAFNKVGKEFDRSIGKDLRNPNLKINTNGLLDGMTSELSDGKVINITEAGIQSGVADIENKLASPIIKKIIPLLKELGNNPTVKAAHEAKRSLNAIIGSKASSEVPAFKQAMIAVKNDLVNRIEVVSPRYKNANQKFRDVFELKDEIGSSLSSKTGSESFLLNLNGAGKSFQREAVKQLDDILPEGKKFADSLFDELAVKSMHDWNPRLTRGVLVGLSALGAGAPPVATLALGAGLTSPRAQATAVRGILGGAQLSRAAIRGLSPIAPTLAPRAAVRGLSQREPE